MRKVTHPCITDVWAHLMKEFLYISSLNNASSLPYLKHWCMKTIQHQLWVPCMKSYLWFGQWTSPNVEKSHKVWCRWVAITTCGQKYESLEGSDFSSEFSQEPLGFQRNPDYRSLYRSPSRQYYAAMLMLRRQVCNSQTINTTWNFYNVLPFTGTDVKRGTDDVRNQW